MGWKNWMKIPMAKSLLLTKADKISSDFQVIAGAFFVGDWGKYIAKCYTI